VTAIEGEMKQPKKKMSPRQAKAWNLRMQQAKRAKRESPPGYKTPKLCNLCGFAYSGGLKQHAEEQCPKTYYRRR
jgi:hypothetical protein